MKRINREAFLHQLQSVQPGLSVRETVEQSNHFIFTNGQVITFNEEVACQNKSSLDKGFKGAVKAKPLLDILLKLPEEEIEIDAADGEMVVQGKRRTAHFTMEAEITLPIDSVEKPGEWRKLHNDFAEAINIVHHCASSKDDSEFYRTCVHLHPKWVEASDNQQLCRWKLKTGVEKPTLVRHSAIKHIVSLGMVEFSETDNWIHFKSSTGLILSCRRYLEEFPNFGQFFEMEGTMTSLPKGLVEAADKAQIFSIENPEGNNHVLINLRSGKLSITGQGISGWYRETKKISYKGKPITFSMSPELLVDVVKRANECLLNESRLKIDTGLYQYVAVLFRPEEVKEESSEETPSEEESEE